MDCRETWDMGMRKSWPKEKWIWMPRPAHFCLSDRCLYRLATYVGKYIVSTVGDCRIKSEDEPQEIGFGRLYETMVFRGEKSGLGCSPYRITGDELDFEGYNSPEDANKGHMRLCEKWSKEP